MRVGDCLKAERRDPKASDLAFVKIGDGHFLGQCYKSKKGLRVRFYNRNWGWDRSGELVSDEQDLLVVTGITFRHENC